MCDPISITTVATAALSVYGQSQAADATNRSYEQTGRNALVAQKNEYDAEAVRANQERESAGQESLQNTVAAARARATAAAAADSSGISGISVDTLINDITAQEGTNAEAIAVNQDNLSEQRTRRGVSANAAATSRINSAPKGNFSPILGALQIGAAGAGAYAGSETYASRRKAGKLF